MFLLMLSLVIFLRFLARLGKIFAERLREELLLSSYKVVHGKRECDALGLLGETLTDPSISRHDLITHLIIIIIHAYVLPETVQEPVALCEIAMRFPAIRQANSASDPVIPVIVVYLLWLES